MKTETSGEKIFNIINICFFILLAFVMIYPIWNLLMVSLSGSGPVISGKVTFVFKEFTMDTYKSLLKTSGMLRAMKNSIIITVCGTAVSISMTVLFAYPLSKPYIIAKGVILKLVIFTMLFNGGMIPSFILIRSLGLMDSFAAIILPAAISQFNLIIMVNFFRAVPVEMEEAARIDGMNDYHILTKIYIPLSLHAIATLALFYAVGYWNVFFTALIYLNDMKKYPLQIVLRQIISNDAVIGESSDAVLDMPPETKKAASIFFTLVPILCVYPFLQKYFVKGIMIGSVKG